MKDDALFDNSLAATQVHERLPVFGTYLSLAEGMNSRLDLTEEKWRATKFERSTFRLGIKLWRSLFSMLTKHSRKMHAHAAHAVRAMPDLRFAGETFGRKSRVGCSRNIVSAQVRCASEATPISCDN